MNLIWRFFWVLLFSRFQSHVNFLEESTLDFRALPTDIDVLMHINNGRYFSLMDLARINFMIRNGTFALLKKNNIYPVIASETARFIKSINFLQKFQIKTQIAGWDDRYFYIEHSFISQDEICAIALVKARFLRKHTGVISPQTVLDALQLPLTSPPLSPYLQTWIAADHEHYVAKLKKA